MTKHGLGCDSTRWVDDPEDARYMIPAGPCDCFYIEPTATANPMGTSRKTFDED